MVVSHRYKPRRPHLAKAEEEARKRKRDEKNKAKAAKYTEDDDAYSSHHDTDSDTDESKRRDKLAKSLPTSITLVSQITGTNIQPDLGLEM